MKQGILILFILFLSSSLLSAQNSAPKKTYTTQRLEGVSPVIDGRLDDLAWDQGQWEGDFVQYEPYENDPPAFDTKFKILYDDNNLYIAFHAYDSAPDSVVRRLSRRDDAQGDLVAIQFDSYNDQRTGFSFFISASGVKEDKIILNDGQIEDKTWDVIWYAKTSITDSGWIAEIQIPLNQLRFGRQEKHTWGLQAARHVFRKQETSLWQPIARNAPGWVHLFGTMDGLQGIHPKRQIDVTPYVSGQLERFEKEPGNPFRTGRSQSFNAGLDAKIGLTNDLILDLAINPDFGQVEADPSEVNLTAFETFFEEKRPFFIEGRGIMSYKLQPGNGDGALDNLFYSRRIGRRPNYFPGAAENQHIDCPSNTSILGAAKLTGKTRHGLSIGIMESFTAREFATVDSEGVREQIEVEPFTNYFVSRISKDFDRGNTIAGGMITAVNRKIDNTDLLFLHQSAYTGGVDFEHSWKNKTYTIKTKLIYSHVAGDSLSLIRTQRSSARYFQRDDALHLSIDSSLNSLSGHGGNIEFWKGGNSKLQFGGFVLWKSPGLELNDIGYSRNADEVFQVFWLGYREHEPKGIFRYWGINVNQWTGFDFSGLMTYKGGNINGNMQFKNYWWFGTGINMSGPSLSKTALRGGPMLEIPGNISNWTNISTDSRKALQIYGGWFIMKYRYDHSQSVNLWGGMTYRPAPAVSISLSPQYNYYRNNLQYVSNINIQPDNRYISALIDQNTFRLSLRANLNISPDITIQYWGQPFISTGKYSNFKYISQGRADNYKERFQLFAQHQLEYNSDEEIYYIDENNDGTIDYSFSNPDYKAIFFQSNLVLRWEYLPGSTVFLVWSQGRNDYFIDGGFSVVNDTRSLYSIIPHNVFLIKLSFRLGLS